jgi:hypothetical protein
MNSMQINDSIPASNPCYFNNFLMVKLNNNVKKNNIIYSIFFHYTLFLWHMLELFIYIFMYLIENPAFTKPAVGYFTLICTNLFLWYDFYIHYLDYISSYSMGYELFLNLNLWLSECFRQVLGIIINYVKIFKNCFLCLFLFLKDVLIIFVSIVKNAWNLIVYFFTIIPETLYLIISTVWFYIYFTFGQVLIYVNIFLILSFKLIGIFCFLILFFYVILYFVDFVEFVIKKKAFFKIMNFLKFLIIFFFRSLKKLFLFFLKYVFFYDFFLENNIIIKKDNDCNEVFPTLVTLNEPL